MVFDSVELAYGFYVSYAHTSGFSVRKNSGYSNHGLPKLKYYVCSEEGFKTASEYNTLDDANNGKRKHRKPFKRTGCGAHIKFRLNEMDYVKESTIHALSQVNVGPVRAFNILKSLYGGYKQVGATKNDFKNFKTRQNEYINEYDADMLIKRLEKKKKYCPNFSFEYTIKEEGSLGGLFWVDEDSKKNYMVFGDVVGFDATYRSNKYDLVLVLFTGIDNHNRNITLGAALLESETAESYGWLLRAYLNTFGSAPKVVVTDQDVAMKRAIQDQLEIEDGIHSFASVTRQQVDDFMKFEIEDLKQPCSTFFEFIGAIHCVMFRSADQTMSCSCRRFELFGLLCRHIFYVLRICFVTKFPKRYIVRRWRKDVVANMSLRTEEFGKNGDDVEGVLRELSYVFIEIMSNVICLMLDAAQVVASPPSRRDRFAEMTGIIEPCSVTIRNPVRTRKKGCGSQKRFKSAREIAISHAGDKGYVVSAKVLVTIYVLASYSYKALKRKKHQPVQEFLVCKIQSLNDFNF
ncbi:protein FAR1-RELATED SEQUENCE 5-like [Bidens hawaiensis]|uniref:protein FAR1-RELATED SEQUENCE 5-like n=1 Tax=Bidens hawaiensis TaxID=980011 RepID=UPI00404920FD